MKHSIFYKFFTIIFIAFLLFQYINLKVDYRSTIEYRLQLLDHQRDESGTLNFTNKMIEHPHSLKEMKWAFENSYDKSGYDKSGYDRNGYDKEGFDRRGFKRNIKK